MLHVAQHNTLRVALYILRVALYILRVARRRRWSCKETNGWKTPRWYSSSVPTTYSRGTHRVLTPALECRLLQSLGTGPAGTGRPAQARPAQARPAQARPAQALGSAGTGPAGTGPAGTGPARAERVGP